MKKSTSIWDRVVFAINILIAFLLLFTGFISYVPLRFFSAISVLSLVVPFLFALNVLFLLYWAAKKKRKFLLSFTAIVLGYLMFGPFYGFGGNNDPQEGVSSDIKIMSFNAWGFNKNGWMKQPGVGDSIVKFVKDQDPTILCVQEHSRDRYRQLNQYKYRSKNFILYNVLSGEKYSISAKIPDLVNMIRELFAAKYSNNRKKDTDEIFYNKYRNIN